MESLSEPSLFASIEMVIKGVDFNVKALIDSGANANFVSEEFVHSNGIKQLKLAEPIVVRMADGRTSAITQCPVLKKFKFASTGNRTRAPLWQTGIDTT